MTIPDKMIDDPNAPEFYASSLSGFSLSQGNITLTFDSSRCDHSDPATPMTRVIVGRLVLPIQAAQALVIELNTALTRVGRSPSAAATQGMALQ